MKITLLTIGKTDEKWLKEGIAKYLDRLKHYISFRVIEISSPKNFSRLPKDLLIKKEAELLLKEVDKADRIYLLDENGTGYSSDTFASFLQKLMNASVREVVFVIGGAFGFHDSIFQKADGKISLSKMTFSHQMIRLFFVEQLYRGFTILKGESYHNP